MNYDLAMKVADSVLYEGYMLYPYRPSALKNRQRWSFGILYPPTYDEVAAGTERSFMHSECIVIAPQENAPLHVQLRFLHLLSRTVMAADVGFTPVPSLSVDGRMIDSWDEGQERSVEIDIAIPSDAPVEKHFRFKAMHTSEPLCDANGNVVGMLERSQQELAGAITISCEKVDQHVFKLALDVTNDASLPAALCTRDDVLFRSLLSAHILLSLERGEFVSLLDPPDAFAVVIASCENVGNFPVLVGNDSEHDMMLCSPIVLYDYPQVAPESAGDFFDATEMDEMLTLRVMTMTDAEKSEARLADSHTRNLLDRTEQTVREQLQRTHGAIRSMRPIGNGHE